MVAPDALGIIFVVQLATRNVKLVPEAFKIS